MKKNNKKVILIILDGFGASVIEEGNAVLKAKTPCLDYLWGNFPKTLITASGEEVGLNWGEIGNSEVGHINIGTGKIAMQNLPRINATISNKTFFENEYLKDACRWSIEKNTTLHLLGLLSNGGVHADVGHLIALIKLAKMHGVRKLSIHLITDGRDMPKRSANILLGKIDKVIKDEKIGKIATICGRYYAMDRDNNWDRIKKAYELLTQSKGEKFENWKAALDNRYKLDEDDENISPIVLENDLSIKSNDAVIFFNFRADRAKQLSEALINQNLKKFERSDFPCNLRFITFVSYGNEQTPLIDVAYFSEQASGQLASIISKENLSQFHIAETEKYAHVTYFFNGGIEKTFKGEERILIPSPKVCSYNAKPEMSVLQVTEQFIKYFKSNSPDFSIINFANSDMVGHTGDFIATTKSIEIIDICLKKIFCNVCNSQTSIIITADHGNAESMINLETKEIDKQHTTNPVPLCIVPFNSNFDSNLSNRISYEEKILFFSQPPSGVLADISPTILNLFDLKKSKEMSGINLKEII